MATLSPRLEDYLESLFYLETTGQKQTVTALAADLHLTKGTIASVVKKMAEQELVLHESYGAVRLTSKGRRIGWQVYMKHERLTSFFHDFLGQDEERSEEIACLIEHHLDGAAANRFFNLVDFLQQAQQDKRDWVPELLSALNNEGRMPAPLTLATVSEGRVCRLTGTDEMKAELQKLGVIASAVLTEIASGKNGAVTVKINDKSVKLDAKSAATVWIL